MTHTSLHSWCKACDRIFLNDFARQQHWEASDIHLLSVCWDCEVDFETKDRLIEHNRNDHVYCEKCDRKFPRLDSRIAHWENAPIRKDSYCRECQDDFLTSDGLKQHWKAHQRHLSTYDFVCDLKFPNEQTCTEHVNADPVKHFVCVQHQLFCGSQEALLTHYYDSKGHAKCVPCKLGFQNEQLRSHHYWASPSHPKCIKCRLSLRNASMLEQHYLTSAVHVKCLSCNQGFNDSTDLEKHYWSSSQHASKCTSCCLGFLSSTDLIAHFKTSPKHFYDEKCGLAFDSVELLREHYVADKNHQYCKTCDISFSSSMQLKDHWMTAEKHRDTYCTRCETHLDNQNALIMHKVLSVRHHLCVRCSHDYPTHEKLVLHLKTSAVHTPTFCKVCNRDFADNTELTEHTSLLARPVTEPSTATVKGRCSHCKSGFDRTSALVRHLDGGKCGVDGKNIVGILKDLVVKEDGVAKKLMVTHQLRTDATKGKELIVKVSMNST
ncbi:MAG: hypothetical protein Q9200_007486 [Gallowayella weberi]